MILLIYISLALFNCSCWDSSLLYNNYNTMMSTLLIYTKLLPLFYGSCWDYYCAHVPKSTCTTPGSFDARAHVPISHTPEKGLSAKVTN